MLGASLYLSEDLKQNLDLIERMHEAGVQTIFTSMHIPEAKPEGTLDILKQITEKTNAYGMELMTDISTNTFDIYGIEKEEATDFFKELGIKSLRMDYGFTYQEMKDFSKDFKIVLNASTIDETVSQELEAVGFDLSDVTACHNFYPRENTGLGRDSLLARNRYLHEKGYHIQAFIPGDQKRRGPIYEGLPTLEEHRYADPLYAYLDLIQNFYITEVLVGDIEMSAKQIERILKWQEEEILTLPVQELISPVPELFFEEHLERPDYAADVVRSQYSRIALADADIPPNNTRRRPMGTITIDNNYYGRYTGEIQITRKDLPADKRVNVLGHLTEAAVPLLQFIQAETKFTFLED